MVAVNNVLIRFVCPNRTLEELLPYSRHWYWMTTSVKVLGSLEDDWVVYSQCWNMVMVIESLDEVKICYEKYGRSPRGVVVNDIIQKLKIGM